MNGAIKALVVLDDRVDRGLVERLVTSSAKLDVPEFVDLTGTKAEETVPGDVAIVGCTEFTSPVGEYLGEARRVHPGRPIVLMCEAALNGRVGEAMGAGADDVVIVPGYDDGADVAALAHEVIFSVEKALARRRGTPLAAGRKLGRMICVLGLK